MKRLCACLLNISEARDVGLVHKIAAAALKINQQTTATDGSTCSDNHRNYKSESTQEIKSSVLNIFNDYDYNRSVLTIAAGPEDIGASVAAACVEAYQLIDLRSHHGGHPRLGAVDLVPIHPISAGVTLEECGRIARDIAETVTSQVPGSSVFLFGHADLPQKRGLVARRKAVHWYDGCHGSSYEGIQQDVGAPPTPRYGLTGIGAIPYVTNCNVTISTQDVEFGRSIAASLRASSPGGIPGVQAMAFTHEGTVEIACNVEGIDITQQTIKEDSLKDLVCSFGTVYHVPAKTIQTRVAAMAAKRNIHTIPEATIIGFTPEEAHEVALRAFSQGKPEYWKDRVARFM